VKLKFDKYNDQGTLFLEENGEQIAYMNLIFRPNNKMVIDETQVMPDYEGQGLGKLLVNAAADLARKNNLRIFSVCPYAKSVFKKTDEYDDVLV